MIEKVCKTSNHYYLKVGEVYNVEKIVGCKCGVVAYALEEIPNFDPNKDPKLKTMCGCGKRINYNRPVFGSWRFEDLNYDYAEAILESVKEPIEANFI